MQADEAVRTMATTGQVWAIVGERVRTVLVAPDRRSATDGVLDEVAAHRVDPYTAADRLLAMLAPGG